jgi:putative membrane protein insertion efficiency factor
MPGSGGVGLPTRPSAPLCGDAWIGAIPVRYLGIALVWAYRLTLGPFLGAHGQCKYHPSCSQYALDAYREFGFFKGTVLAGWRLLRCNPWSRGGVDYARDQRVFT